MKNIKDQLKTSKTNMESLRLRPKSIDPTTWRKLYEIDQKLKNFTKYDTDKSILADEQKREILMRKFEDVPQNLQEIQKKQLN